MARAVPLLRLPADLFATAVLWVYFIGAFFLFVLPGYGVALVRGGDRAFRVQRVHHWYLRGFLRLACFVGPGLSLRIDPALRAVRSSVVICNHISYFDPLVLVATFPRHTTFVKGVFFRTPVFRSCLRLAGYLPTQEADRGRDLGLGRMEFLRRHLEAGGNLFIFPEGRRGVGGELGPFRTGAFRLARRFGVPLELAWIRNTDRALGRGAGRLHTGFPNRIELVSIGRSRPDYDAPDFSPVAWAQEIRGRYVNHIAAQAVSDRAAGDAEPGASLP